MLVILFALFQGEPAPVELASVVSKDACNLIAASLNSSAPAEAKVKFGCYERKPTVKT